ncbi:MAG: hypothetical protein MI723_11920, partial [Caulobacterales bacterium]|nr:hypothetical protein [Caulobacterales bacterium]
APARDPGEPFALPAGWDWSSDYVLAVSDSGEVLTFAEAERRFTGVGFEETAEGSDSFEYGLR